jgi:PII-like signaling protein
MEPGPASDPSQPRSPGSADALELTIYVDPLRDGGRSSFYDALADEYAHRGLKVSYRLPVAESFGRLGKLRQDNSAEIDSPLLVMAIDASSNIRSALGAVSTLIGDALVTLASTEIVFGAEALQRLGMQPAELVVHCRRGTGRADPHGVGGVIEQLRRHGIAGATALGRAEGTTAGQRHRPGLLSPSPDGPTMVVAIDSADVFARAAPALLPLPQVELVTAKPIALCKWRGRREQPPAPSADRPAWSRITLYAAGEASLGWRPEHLELIKRLRKLGAPGATTLRGTTGYALSDPMRPERGWHGHRTAPTVTTIIDIPDHATRWLRAIDEVTDDNGLVTHDFISAYRLM